MASRFLYLVRHGEAVHDGVLSEVGQQQARLTGARLADVPFAAIHHGPLPRTVQTTRLISASMPRVPVHSSSLLGDFIPSVPDQNTLAPGHAKIVASYSADELIRGPKLAAAAIQRFAVPAAEHTRELLVTHNFLIGWFVRHALDAPPDRWLGLNQSNCAITVILYRPNRPPSLISFNDMEHLPPPLRWSGFPPELHL